MKKTSFSRKIKGYFQKLKSHPFLLDLFIILLLILVTLFTYQFLITALKTVVFGDSARYNGYFAMIIKYSLVHYGQFGLWDQFISSGISWISHPSGLHFSPIAWLTILFFNDPVSAGRFMELSYISFASVAFYFLLRVFNLSRVTSFIISVPYVANQYAFLFGVNGWFEEFMGIMLLPLTVMFIWLGITQKNYLYMLIGSIIMSLHFFDNSYYVFHYNAIVLLWITFILGLQLLWKNRKERSLKLIKRFFSYASLNVVFWLGFIGISAVKLIPLLEFRALSSRSFISLSEAEAEITPFPFLWDRLRNFFITPGHTTSFTQLANDIGIFLVFICLLYFLLKRSLLYGIFLGLLLIGIWGYLANQVPIDFYSLMYNFLPGFNSNRYPFRFMIIIQFAFMVCVALGLDVLIRQKKLLLLRLLGLIFGAILIFSTVSFMLNSFSSASLATNPDLQDAIKKSENFIVKKGNSYKNPPALSGTIPENLLVVLSKIMKEYGPEGRMHSTFYSNSSPYLTANTQLLLGEIPSTQHSYGAIMPTYEYGIVTKASTQDSLELTKKRYKIFSVLNSRFQFQQKENFEYRGCDKLALSGNSNENTQNKVESPAEGVCKYLEGRLAPIVTREEGGIYYDKNVLTKVTVISNPILIISDNRFNDYSGFIAKQIMFHTDFDINTMTVLSGGSTYLDDYSTETLNRFSAIILVEPKIKNKEKVNLVLSQYEKNGGRVLSLSSKWNHYESLHDRSGSIFTNKPAWSYSDKDSQLLSNLFKSLKTNQKQDSIDVKKFTPEDVLLSVKITKDNQVLQYSDSFYPGWKATIDGEKTPVYMADGLVKGVVIPKKGTHIIRFYYDPDSLKKGAIISGITLIFILIYIIYDKRLFIRRL